MRNSVAKATLIRNRDKQEDLIKGDCIGNKVLSERAVFIGINFLS
jgi:hypothetical protein